MSSAAQVPPIQVVTTAQFLELPEDLQLLFLSGILEGISFTSYTRPDHDKWVACVQKDTMGALLKQVLASASINPEVRKEPVPWLVVRAIGARDCPK